MDVYVSRHRAAEDAATFFRRAIEATGAVPDEVATDGAAAYPPALEAALPPVAHETGKAIVMAALTAIVGYGSFAISHYPGLRSIGYASTFGIGLSGLAAITLLPAILVMGHEKDEGRRQKAEG